MKQQQTIYRKQSNESWFLVSKQISEIKHKREKPPIQAFFLEQRNPKQRQPETNERREGLGEVRAPPHPKHFKTTPPPKKKNKHKKNNINNKKTKTLTKYEGLGELGLMRPHPNNQTKKTNNQKENKQRKEGLGKVTWPFEPSKESEQKTKRKKINNENWVFLRSPRFALRIAGPSKLLGPKKAL